LAGGVALRYRLYSRQGLKLAAITQVLVLSVVTNWLGYCALAGLAALLLPLALPPEWSLGRSGLRLAGVLLLVLAAAYLLWCFSGQRRVWHLRGRDFTLPSGPTALLQLLLSCANWMLIAGVVAVLLHARVDYPTVLGVLLVAAVAGAVAHVPAGLGVLEAVFVALLSSRVPTAELLAALLVYRAIYYLAPLGVAVALYLLLETQARDGGAAAPAPAARAVRTP
jgi:uncharacterized membrane protein YbhN (UPF0104 family)